MRKRSRDWGVPENIIIPVVARMQRTMGRCCDNWVTYEFEELKRELGPEYAHIPVDDIRRYAIHLRKGSKLGSVKGHGPSKSRKPTAEMLEYYKSDHWQEFAARVREFWDFRCAMCNSSSKLDVHHRTYERLHHENLTDCIPLCRNCHKAADQRRTREAARGYELFS